MLYGLEKISLIYNLGKRQIPIISNFNLKIEEGEFLVLMGPSGSGKTTLLNMIAGFLSPSTGVLFYKNQNLYKLNNIKVATYRNRNLGMIHQFFNLIPEFTALYNIMTPILIKGDSKSDARQKAEILLDKVKLLHRAKHYPSELSGGEQQRVAIARALINNPEIILADEPTGNLDKQTSVEIMDLMSSLHREGKTFIVATHDEEVAKRGTRVIDFNKLPVS